MRRRLYVVLPDLASARQTANDLLLARIEDRHMHFLGRRDMSLGELHEASVLQKTDLRHAFFLGSGIGLVIGAALGVYLKVSSRAGYSFGVGTVVQALRGRLRGRPHPADGRRAACACRRDTGAAASPPPRGRRPRHRLDDAGVSVVAGYWRCWRFSR
jgi:hypothetical protein